MKLVQFVQLKFAILGISPKQQYPPNKRIQMIFTAFRIFNIQNAIILTYKPNNFIEDAIPL